MLRLPPFGKAAAALAEHSEVWIYNGGNWNDARRKVGLGVPAVVLPDGEDFEAFDWAITRGREVLMVHRAPSSPPFEFASNLVIDGARVARVVDRWGNFWRIQ